MSRKQFNNIFLKDFNIKAKKSLENNDTFLSDEEIESVFKLINKRETLREEKQFEEADKIRDQIAGMGISLIDHKNKTLWMKKEPIKSEKQ